MEMSKWAEKELELVRKECQKLSDMDASYSIRCYESAVEAFKILCGQGHSGYSIKLTQHILNRLINGQVLTPIEDTEDMWRKCYYDHDNHKMTYQCVRMSSLFKDVYDTSGEIKYHDVDRCYCIDINDPHNTYSNGLVREIIHEMFPIVMPYMPDKPFRVICESFLSDKINGDSDTIGIFRALKDKDGEQQIVDINRFFRAPEVHETYTTYTGWVEISKKEYYELKAKAL